jgi:hypothetical protein
MKNETASRLRGVFYRESSGVSMTNVSGAVGKFTDWRALAI